MTEPMSERTLSEEQLSEIEERAGKATPGPWWDESGVIHAPASGGGATHPASVPYVQACLAGTHEDVFQTEADAEFIAAARTDVPALCAALRAAWAEGAGAAATARDLREENERLRAALAVFWFLDGYVGSEPSVGPVLRAWWRTEGRPALVGATGIDTEANDG